MLVGLFFVGMSLTGCAELDQTLGTHTASSGSLAFDKHGCLVRNGSYVGTLCYAKQYSGKQWYGYERSVLQAAGWNPNLATASVIRDFSQGLGVVKWRDANGNGTWYLKDTSTGAVSAFYKGKWMPLQQYRDTVDGELAVARINSEADQKLIETILAPDCNYSFNGCR